MSTPQQSGTGTPRIAPVQRFAAGIPWEMHLRAYDAYCKRWSPQPALIEGWCRGGFDIEELDVLIPGWHEELSTVKKLETELIAARAEVERLKESELTWAASSDHYAQKEFDLRTQLQAKEQELARTYESWDINAKQTPGTVSAHRFDQVVKELAEAKAKLALK